MTFEWDRFCPSRVGRKKKVRFVDLSFSTTMILTLIYLSFNLITLLRKAVVLTFATDMISLLVHFWPNLKPLLNGELKLNLVQQTIKIQAVRRPIEFQQSLTELKIVRDSLHHERSAT